MLTAGQEVNTKYGVGVVVSSGSTKPQIFVRILANSRIYVLDGADVTLAKPARGDSAGAGESSRFAKGVEPKGEKPAAVSVTGGVKGVWRRQMKRGQTERSRHVEETPLSLFVGARLAALGMKQSEFCRLTGFDQGLLSKIQSSMISKLNLEGGQIMTLTTRYTYIGETEKNGRKYDKIDTKVLSVEFSLAADRCPCQSGSTESR